MVFPSRPFVRIVLLALVIGWSWSLYTNHVWEDYYITYRAARNLATGHGLVFTDGERLHTFTSPIGVLIPALCSVLTGNRSDVVAMWIYRVFSIGAYAGTAVLLWSMSRTVFREKYPALLLVGLYLTDAKIVDFSTNGMETAFLLLFLGWTLLALFSRLERPAVHLGLAWAGLMWSRPDAFVYIGALSLGMLWLRPAGEGAERRQFLKTLMAAAAIAAACYLPWFLWAWWYYGTPIPHTILAKGLEHHALNVSSLIDGIMDLPGRLVRPEYSLASTFMPPYGHDEKSGWPLLAVGVSRLLAVAIALVWLFPFATWRARVTSLAFAAGHVYLMYFASFHYPWYLPPITLLGFATIAFLTGQALEAAEAWKETKSGANFIAVRRRCLIATLWIPLGGLLLSLGAACQLRWQQQLIELGQRRNIGLWLREHANPGRDRVFLEPLGYIGFYSGLKMLDYPGLSSSEVIDARRKILALHPERTDRAGWADLIFRLRPDWLVLRPFEADKIRQRDSRLLGDYYRKEKTFDVSGQIRAIKFLPGRPYLLYDENFEIYHLRPDADQQGFRDALHPRMEVTLQSIQVVKAFAEFKNDGRTLLAHAPSVFRQVIPANAVSLRGRYGFFDGAYRDASAHTPGAEFIVWLRGEDGTRHRMLTRFLQPYLQPADRGDQNFALALPAGVRAEIEFEISDARVGSNEFGWTYWKDLEFVLSPLPDV